MPRRLVMLNNQSMNEAFFRFYAELNYFLTPDQDGGVMKYEYWGQPAVKDAVEAIGVPHTEVALILINGQPAPFETQLQSGDRVSVYPAFRDVRLGSTLRLGPAPLSEPAFIADIHLGQLSRYLRMIGFSCLYRNDAEDASLAKISANQDRILLTRDQELLKRSVVQRGYYLRSDHPKHQLVEVVRRFQLEDRLRPFQYCMECDGDLIEVPKQEVVDHLPESVQRDHQEFRRCSRCHRVYWGGSHVARMRSLIKWLKQQVD